MLLTWIVGFSLIGSIGAIILAGAYLLFPEGIRQILILCLISYATGTLLGAAFLGLLQHALEHAPAASILSTVLVGILAFFLLEKIVIWRHCHNAECEKHATAGILLLIGDALHNFIDGIAIAAAFVASIPIGMTTALAVFAHEFPQEVGDFAILLESGYSRRRALVYNMLSSLSTLPGAVLAYYFLMEVQEFTANIMALSAASFIYIAIADLIPSLHRQSDLKHAVSQFVFIIAGIGTILLFHMGK
ncbi:MAG: ZIP zinc transporter [Chloroflexi bacterium RIFOXYD12_FULL_57_15]|nr:MAG: ZIP zinc transporter [Chloroflexi bacterium RIFOXYD12_FULL_57_15]